MGGWATRPPGQAWKARGRVERSAPRSCVRPRMFDSDRRIGSHGGWEATREDDSTHLRRPRSRSTSSCSGSISAGSPSSHDAHVVAPTPTRCVLKKIREVPSGREMRNAGVSAARGASCAPRHDAARASHRYFSRALAGATACRAAAVCDRGARFGAPRRMASLFERQRADVESRLDAIVRGGEPVTSRALASLQGALGLET